MNTMLAWVATYLVHSTILILGAWLLERRWRDRPERMSAVWKVALVGGVATASLQMLLSISPVGGVYNVSPPASVPSDPVLAADAAPVVASVREPVPARDASSRAVVIRVRKPASDRDEVVASSPGSTPAGPGTSSLLHGAAPWIIGAITLGAMVGLFSIMGAVAVLRQRLQGRQRLRNGALVDLLDRLRRSAGLERSIELAVADSVRTPMALGVLRPQIVLPREATEVLTADQQAGLLAHEVAHVVRRDPMWRLIGLVMERVLFFQPLNRLASRRVATFAEYLCDDWAAQHTHAPLDLARCLTEVARWIAQPSVVAATMVGPRSILGNRVQRLIRPPARREAPRWLALPLGGLLLTMLLVAPNVSAQRRDADTTQTSRPPSLVLAHAEPSVQPLMLAEASARAPERERRESKRRRASARKAKDKRKRKAKKSKSKHKAKAKAKAKAKHKTNGDYQAYTITEDGSMVRIELSGDVARALEGLEKLETLELENLENLENLEQLEGIEARVELQLRDLEELEALETLVEIQEVELEKVEALAESIEVIERDGQTTIEFDQQGFEISIEADGDRITVEVRDEDGKRTRTKRRRRSKKHRRSKRRR